MDVSKDNGVNESWSWGTCRNVGDCVGVCVGGE